jgi:glutaredoxin 3
MKLELFKYDACPFCMMVIQVVEDLNIKVTYCDTSEDEAHLLRLIEDTSRRTVPCLYINGTPMFESRDIIRWLKENVDNLEKNT